MQDISQFDFVIVGAGSAGCALAGRLSENPDCSVALVEAGPSDRNWRVQTPVALVNLMRNPKFNWMFDSAPQTQLDGRTMATPRGKTLGGSSSINSMVYIRGRATDYDAWEQSGCDGWGWRSVLPYFRKAENNTRLRDEFHGHDGPLIVGDLPSPHPLCNDWIAAGESVGIPHNTDFNGKNQEGLGIYQVTMQNGRRWSASDAYLGRIGSKRNLTVFTDTEVLKIDTKANRANSIVVTHAGRTRSIRVAKELILSAGAIGSPKLLLESGIGPEADLNKLGIPVVHNLGAVGENLQEHVSIGIAEKCDAGRGLSLPTLPSILWSPFRYLLRGDGLMSTNHVEAGGFARTDDSLDEPDVQFHMIPARVGVESKGVVWGRGYFADACLLKPRSRGRLTIRGTTNGFQPIIDFNALHDANDRIRIVAAFRLLRRIMKADPLARHNPVEDSPGRHLESDEEIYEHCKRRLGTAYHPVGTCRMGPADRSDSVVDPNLRLLGMKNMRIVDASVMPELIAGNTNAPTIMIAEYAAHKILGGLG